MSALALALLLAGAAGRPAAAKPLIEFKDVPEYKSADEELKDGEVKLEEIQARIKSGAIDPIEFEFDKAVLRDSSHRALEAIAELLLTHPNLKLMVFGHTCDIGSEEYNLWLSKKRAAAVKSYLIKLGVLGESVKAKGFGKSRPLLPNDSEENRAKNRRVELILTTRWWESIY
jgi:outer membrane protein OmpA-like peptidoglycan-associated protein